MNFKGNLLHVVLSVRTSNWIMQIHVYREGLGRVIPAQNADQVIPHVYLNVLNFPLFVWPIFRDSVKRGSKWVHTAHVSWYHPLPFRHVTQPYNAFIQNSSQFLNGASYRNLLSSLSSKLRRRQVHRKVLLYN